jgi:putative inorganic carbon (hco3(-)) transporter
MNRLFWIYLLLVFLRPQEILTGMENVPILQIVLMSCLFLWVVSKDKDLSLPPFALVACLLAYIPLTVGLSGWWGGVPVAFGIMAPVVGIFIIASKAARELPALHSYMRATIGCACVLVYHSMVQLHTGIGPLTDVLPQLGRPYYVGIFADPNDLGQLFVIALAFSIYLLIVSHRRAVQFLLCGCGAWLVYGLVLADSRGALLALAVLAGLEGWRRYGKIAVVICAALTLPALAAVTRLSEMSAGEKSAVGRIQAWYQGMQMLLTHPLIGVGFGNFTVFNELTAHNFVVLPMGELGIIGLTIWLGIIWYAVRMLWWIAYGPHAPAAKSKGTVLAPEIAAEIVAARGLLMTFVGFIVSAFFLSQSYKLPLFLLCGFAVARFSAASRVLPNPPHYRLMKDLPKILGISLALVAAIYVFVKLTL